MWKSLRGSESVSEYGSISGRVREGMREFCIDWGLYESDTKSQSRMDRVD